MSYSGLNPPKFQRINPNHPSGVLCPECGDHTAGPGWVGGPENEGRGRPSTPKSWVHPLCLEALCDPPAPSSLHGDMRGIWGLPRTPRVSPTGAGVPTPAPAAPRGRNADGMGVQPRVPPPLLTAHFPRPEPRCDVTDWGPPFHPQGSLPHLPGISPPSQAVAPAGLLGRGTYPGGLHGAGLRARVPAAAGGGVGAGGCPRGGGGCSGLEPLRRGLLRTARLLGPSAARLASEPGSGPSSPELRAPQWGVRCRPKPAFAPPVQSGGLRTPRVLPRLSLRASVSPSASPE